MLFLQIKITLLYGFPDLVPRTTPLHTAKCKPIPPFTDYTNPNTGQHVCDCCGGLCSSSAYCSTHIYGASAILATHAEKLHFQHLKPGLCTSGLSLKTVKDTQTKHDKADWIFTASTCWRLTGSARDVTINGIKIAIIGSRAFKKSCTYIQEQQESNTRPSTNPWPCGVLPGK